MMSENGGRYKFLKRVNIFTNGHYIFTLFAQENPVDNNVSAQSSVFSASLVLIESVCLSSTTYFRFSTL